MTHFIFIQLVLAVALAAVFTEFACRVRVARGMRPAAGAVYAGAFGAAAIAVMFSVFLSVGARGFSPEFWANPALPGVKGYLAQWVVTGMACLVPAACVAARFRHRMG
ncbi:MAG: hypothetical protein J0M04_03820 [Verrucomicrobia bacterium]|nr:hypothetical protein [Verrucomicrobiota bacterium]